MALFEAYDHGADSTVLVDAEGNIVEGPGFNLFVRSGDTVVTPGRGVLEGVTRATILELLDNENLPVKQDVLTPAMAQQADEAFITSTAGGVMPVTRMSGKTIGSGSPGELTAKLNDAYWALHDDPRFSEAIEY